MATGPIMAIGAVDMLIPPSALTVLLGSLSGISISKLLIGGVVPGLILSRGLRRLHRRAREDDGPSLAPPTPIAPQDGLGSAGALLVLYVLPLVVDLRRGGRRDGGRLGDADRSRRRSARWRPWRWRRSTAC